MDDAIHKLTTLFARFPGVGARQAKRFVYFLLRDDPAQVRELAERIGSIKQAIVQCPTCFVYFEPNGFALCDVCGASRTDATMLMIVEKDADCESIKKSKTYAGRYFILGGLVPIAERDVERKIRTRELSAAVRRQRDEHGLQEIIFALSSGPQGDYTDHYLRQFLAPFEEAGVKFSSLGRGLSTGTELEYSDNETIKNALKNRG